MLIVQPLLIDPNVDNKTCLKLCEVWLAAFYPNLFLTFYAEVSWCRNVLGRGWPMSVILRVQNETGGNTDWVFLLQLSILVYVCCRIFFLAFLE